MNTTITKNYCSLPTFLLFVVMTLSESIDRQGLVNQLAVETPQLTSVETRSISDDEEWDPPTEFAAVLTKIAKLLNGSADVEDLKDFLEFLCHPRTHNRYINIKVYEHCQTPREIIKALVPQYINFMHTHLLRRIVRKFGNEQSQTLLKQYEDTFPRKRPLKRMDDPVSDEEIEACSGSKRIKCKYDGNVDTTTVEDIEKVQQTISKKTGIDESVIVYANWTAGSVIFTFLIPETVVTAFCNMDEDDRRDLANHGILSIEVNDLVMHLQSSQLEAKTDTLQTETMNNMIQVETRTDVSQAKTKTDSSCKSNTSRTDTKTDSLQAETKNDESLGEIKTSTSVAETRSGTSKGETKIKVEMKTDTSHGETKSDTSHADARTDVSWPAGKIDDMLLAETNPDLSTYTTSGMKRVPLTIVSLKSNDFNSEFQWLISELEATLTESVEGSKLKRFLHSFSHILYPEAQYVDPSVLIDAETVPQIFTALQPQIINFLNWGVLWKVTEAFGSNKMSAIQSYASRLPPDTQLFTLLDPLSEKEISQFRGFQKLRVTCGGGSEMEWTFGDVKAVKKAIEKATGIDQDFIIYGYWEGGFTTHQFTFLIPKSISGIFHELCMEDLTILAEKGVQRLEVEYDTVADNIQEHYVAPVKECNKMRTKNFGLQHFVPEVEIERMSGEEFSHLNNLIKNTPAGKLQEICSDGVLKELAKKMGSWKDLAPYLGINEWNLEELAEVYPGDDVEQKCVALLTWKGIDVTSATYERLVECLLTHGHVDDAKELLLHLQGK